MSQLRFRKHFTGCVHFGCSMNVKPECLPCLFDRAALEVDLVAEDDRDKIMILAEIAEFVAEHYGPTTVPAFLGTNRERIIQRASGRDPYEALKRESNQVASQLLPLARQFYEDYEDKLEALIRIAAAANSMEFGVRGHSFDNQRFVDGFEATLSEKLYGDPREVEEALQTFERVIYLTDNAGEIVFDLFVVEKLLEMSKEVILSPKSGPVLNDATASEVEELGVPTQVKIVPSGRFVGLSLEEAPPEFLEHLRDTTVLVIAKGMGNYETISEFEDELRGRLIYILRAKCQPVADSIGTKRGNLVVKRT